MSNRKLNTFEEYNKKKNKLKQKNEATPYKIENNRKKDQINITVKGRIRLK